MLSLQQQLTDLVSNAFASAGFDPKYGQVTVSSRPDLSDFQSNGALAAAKEYKTNPTQVAEKVTRHLADNKEFREVTVAGAGFLNFKLSDTFLLDYIQSMLADSHFGVNQAETPTRIVIDFGGPNVAKPLHV